MQTLLFGPHAVALDWQQRSAVPAKILVAAAPGADELGEWLLAVFPWTLTFPP